MLQKPNLLEQREKQTNLVKPDLLTKKPEAQTVSPASVQNSSRPMNMAEAKAAAAAPMAQQRGGVSRDSGVRQSYAARYDSEMSRLENLRRQAAVDLDVDAINRLDQQMKELRASAGKQTIGDRVSDVTGAWASDLVGAVLNAAGTVVNTVQDPEHNRRQAARLEQSLASGYTSDGKPINDVQRKAIQDSISRLRAEAAAWESEDSVADKLYKIADIADADTQRFTSSAKQGLGKAGQVAVDVGIAGGQLLTDIAANTVLPGAGLALMGIRSFGGSAQEARQSGATLGQQLAYGTGSALTSVAVEKIASVAAPFRKAFGSGVIDKLVPNLVNRLTGSAAGKLALSALSEGGEEFVEAVIQPVLQRATYNPDASFDLEQALYDAAIGAALGSLGGVGDVMLSGRRSTQTQELKMPQLTDPLAEAKQKTASTVGAENSRLTDADLEEYMQAGERLHVRDLKARILEGGDSPILAKASEIVDFIRKSFSGEIRDTVKGYGKVGTRFADTVRQATNGEVTIDGYYLELDANRIAHLSDHVRQDKDARNIPLTVEQAENIPEYIDNFDDLIEVIRRKDGSVRLMLGKKINGHSIIIEAVSKGRKALHPVTAYQIDSQKYEENYKTRAIGRSSTSRPDNTGTVDISRPATAPAEATLSHPLGSVNMQGGDGVNDPFDIMPRLSGVDAAGGSPANMAMELRMPQLTTLAVESGRESERKSKYAEKHPENIVRQYLSEHEDNSIDMAIQEIAGVMESEALAEGDVDYAPAINSVNYAILTEDSFLQHKFEDWVEKTIHRPVYPHEAFELSFKSLERAVEKGFAVVSDDGWIALTKKGLHRVYDKHGGIPDYILENYNNMLDGKTQFYSSIDWGEKNLSKMRENINDPFDIMPRPSGVDTTGRAPANMVMELQMPMLTDEKGRPTEQSRTQTGGADTDGYMDALAQELKMPQLTDPTAEANAERNAESPMEIENVKQMLNDENESIPDADGEDFSFAQQLQTQGVSYDKDLARNLDAAAGKDKKLRQRLREVFEYPMEQAKTAYTMEVRSRVNDLKTTMDDLGIQAGSRESAAVQWIGEGQRQDRYGEIQEYTLEQLKRDFPKTWENIVKAERYFRKTYDEYIERINNSLTQIYPNAVENAEERLGKQRGTERYYREQAVVQQELADTLRMKIEEQQEKLNHSRTGTKRNAALQNSILYQSRRLESTRVKMEHYLERAERAASVAASIEADIENGTVLRNKRLIPRKDYFHHFQEMETGLKGLVTLLSTPADIDSKLAGQSDTTKPKTKWTGFMQQRKGGAYVEDAIGGMLKYIPAAEYKVSIDPQIARGRMLTKGMAEATEDTRNANKFIEWYMDYVNDLAGKTNPIDRPVQKLVGRKAMGALRWLNSRVKSNAIMGNMRSAVSQFFNLPNAAAYIKNPISWGKGLKLYSESLLHKDGAKDVMNQSGFLSERYLDDVFTQFDEGILKKPKKFANWLLSFGDKQSTKLIWSAAYSDAVQKGEANPISYADDLTRRSVAGRGIGEVPLTQKSQLVQLVAPFQVEVNNAWQLMKEKVSQKDALGLLGIFVGNFVMNTVTRELFGFDVSYDPINALIEALTGDDDEEKTPLETAVRVIGRQAGELLNAMPGGTMIADYVFPDEADREKLFGESDPTRFGTGNIGLNMLMKPVLSMAKGEDFSDDLMSTALNIGMPLGGKQTERIINSAQDMGWVPELRLSLTDGVEIDRQTGGASYSSSGRLRFPIDTKDPWNVAKGLALGSFSTDEGRSYLESGALPLSENLTEVYRKLVANGADGGAVYQAIRSVQQVEKTADKLEVLAEQRLTDQEKWQLYTGAVAAKDSKRPEQFRQMLTEGMTWQQITETYLEYARLNEADMGAAEKATHFAAYLDNSGLNNDQKDVVTGALKFYSQLPAEAGRYEKLTAAGLSTEDAVSLTAALSDLQPLEGKENVSYLQRYRTVVDFGLSNTEQMNALESMMEESEFEKLKMVCDTGLTPAQYVGFRETINGLSSTKDANGKDVKGQTKKDKVMAVIDAMQISNDQKTALYLYAADYKESTLYDDAPWYQLRPRLDTGTMPTLTN